MINIIKLNEIAKRLSKFKESEEAISKISAFQKLLTKKGQEENPLDPELFLNFMACLKLNLIWIQTAHWISKGKSSYGDHLLYERIYENLLEEIDKYSERSIGLAGESAVNPIKISEIVAEELNNKLDFQENMDEQEIAETSLKSEKCVTEKLEQLYNEIKKAGKMSMGLDDLLMEMHSSHQEHIYLIQQRLKN